MIRLILILAIALMSNSGFKTEQLKYIRVSDAFSEKENNMKLLVLANAVDVNHFSLYIRAYKEEDELELWAKSKSQT